MLKAVVSIRERTTAWNSRMKRINYEPMRGNTNEGIHPCKLTFMWPRRPRESSAFHNAREQASVWLSAARAQRKQAGSVHTYCWSCWNEFSLMDVVFLGGVSPGYEVEVGRLSPCTLLKSSCCCLVRGLGGFLSPSRTWCLKVIGEWISPACMLIPPPGCDRAGLWGCQWWWPGAT